MTYPPALDQAIADQNISSITDSILIPAIKAAHLALNKPLDEQDPSQLETLHAILNRLLDPEEMHDDIVEAEDLVKIFTACAPVVDEMSKTSSGSDSHKRTAQILQGLLAWAGTTPAFVLLGDLVLHERRWYAQPQQPFTQFEECTEILHSLQPLITAYSFISSTIREQNRKFHQYPLIFNLSHAYLTWISGFLAYFGGRFMESANTLLNATTSATSIIQHLNTIYPAAQPLLSQSTNDLSSENAAVLAAVSKSEALPFWISYPRAHTLLQKVQFDSFVLVTKFAPTLPHNMTKAKLLTSITTNEVFQAQKRDIDEYFFPGASSRAVYFGNQIGPREGAQSESDEPKLKSPFEAFHLLVTDSILTDQRDRDLNRREVVLWTECLEKLVSNTALTLFEVNYLSAINKTPLKVLQELNFRHDSMSPPSPSGGSEMNDDVSDPAAATSNDTNNNLASSPFIFPTLSPLLQHNLLTVTNYTTSISFPQLCVVLGLDQRGKRTLKGLGEMVKKMILDGTLPIGWSKIDNTVTTPKTATDGHCQNNVVSVLNLKSNSSAVAGTQGRVEAMIESQSLFLRHVYDAAIDGEKYHRQWQQHLKNSS